jgi:hypothetical protein
LPDEFAGRSRFFLASAGYSQVNNRAVGVDALHCQAIQQQAGTEIANRFFHVEVVFYA